MARGELVSPISASRKDKRRRVVLSAATSFALILVACVLSSGGYSGRDELAQAQAGLTKSATTGAAGMSEATGTLSLFDTTAADHDGEKWSPPPKLTPAQKQERLAEKSIKETEKLEAKVDPKVGKAIKGEVNVRNYPAIHEETKRMEEETARKVDEWTTTAGQRKAAYDGFKEGVRARDSQFQAQVKTIKRSIDENRKKEIELTGAQAVEHGQSEDSASSLAAEASSYEDWYTNEYQKSLKKVMAEKQQFKITVGQKKNPYEDTYQQALAVDRERQQRYAAKMKELRSLSSTAESERVRARAAQHQGVAAATKSNEAALERQVDNITGSLDEGSVNKEAAKNHEADKDAAARDEAALEKQVDQITGSLHDGGAGDTKAKARSDGGKQAIEAKNKVVSESANKHAEAPKAQAGKPEETKLGGDHETAKGAKSVVKKLDKLSDNLAAVKGDPSIRAEIEEEQIQREQDRKAERAMGRKARMEEKQEERGLRKAGWGDASSVGAGSSANRKH